MTRARFGLALLVALTTIPSSAVAQSNLSTQGLGFPPGQLSTRAITMGGSVGEVDPLSPLNPAAIGLLGSAILMMQAEPEFREVRVGDQLQRTSVSRFPVFLGALPVGGKWAVGFSASTLLDRTWETTTRDTQMVGSETITLTRNQASDGSIADLRIAVSYAPRPWLKLGVGGHAFSGRDLVRTELAFDDSAFATDVQGTTLGFRGSAVSLGAHAALGRLGALGLSYRKGGRFDVEDRNTTVGSGFAPDRFGASVVYLGIQGTTLAFRAAKDDWSRLTGTAPTLRIHEGWDLGVGGDVTGPSFGTNAMSVRVGGRWRTLPFSATTTPVKEQTWSGGFGFPIARGDVQLNLGVLRALRKSDAGVSERAWTISTGFAVRP